MPTLMNIKGFSLVSVFIIIFILMTILLAALNFALKRKVYIKRDIDTMRASCLAEAGMNRFLYVINRDRLGLQDVLGLELEKVVSPDEKYRVENALLGGYILVKSSGVAGSRTVTRKALVGLLPGPEGNAAIINSSHEHPLVIAGRTIVNGAVYVASGKLMAGSIEGEIYARENLINGEIVQYHPDDILRFDENEYFDFFDPPNYGTRQPARFFPGNLTLGEDNMNLIESPVLSVENNLEISSVALDIGGQGASIVAGGNIEITGDCRLYGLLRIETAQSITIRNDSKLVGVTLVAGDSIIFRDRVLFSGQAVSRRAIRVTGGTRIRYPSLLMINSDEKAETGIIEFLDSAIAGVIAVNDCGCTIPESFCETILVDSGSLVQGAIICRAGTQLKGILHGFVLTEYFRLKREPITYINWLENAVIDRHKLGFLPVLPAIFNNYGEYAIFRLYEEI